MTDIEIRTSGASISASQSDRVVVRLPENSTTGYQWSIAEIGEALEVESNEFFIRGQMMPGAGGERVIIVRPRRSGRARLSLDLKRRWDQKPIDHFEVEINVTDQLSGLSVQGASTACGYQR
jgi:predicted secreted protein